MRNIEITNDNVATVPRDLIVHRYKKIKRCLSSKHLHLLPAHRQEYENEMQLIQQHIFDTGSGHLLAEQETMLEITIPKKATYAAIVEDKLRSYFILSLRSEEIRRKLLKGPVEIVFPGCTSSYNFDTVSGTNSYTSSTERSIMRPVELTERLEEELKDLSLRMEPIERALNKLSIDQRELIEAKYLVKREPKDDKLMQDLNYGRDKYYKLKKSAIVKLATSFNLIYSRSDSHV